MKRLRTFQVTTRWLQKDGVYKDIRRAMANPKKRHCDAEFEVKSGVRAVVILVVPDREVAHGGLI
jgi:hypothetical protein